MRKKDIPKKKEPKKSQKVLRTSRKKESKKSQKVLKSPKKRLSIKRRKGEEQYPLILTKSPENPIISPKAENGWESWQTFNPGVILEENKVHFLYRAIGEDGISRLGYATSSDGLTIKERLPYPVYEHRLKHYTFNVYSYASGGGWGGAEDPRLTRIEETTHMVYVALDGSNPPQLAITSIKSEDFIHRNWKWSNPSTISPPGIIAKSGCLFPEKIKGKFVMFYRIFPHIWAEFLDDLDFRNSRYLAGAPRIFVRENFWDSRKIGAGAPPIKTQDGWLLIYYGVDNREPSKYKIGAMLLDLEDPCKVVYRSNQPILGPDDWYENNGHKAGIAYPCGSVVKDDNLLIYYGGADSYVCVAYTNLAEFLSNLKKESKPQFKHKIVKKKS